MKDNIENNALRGCSEAVIGVVLGLLACLLITLCSCKAQREMQIERVEVPVVVTQEHTIESVRIDHIRDTLIQRDSIYHYIKGDTTIIERWHYLQGNSLTTRIDTLHIYDSVPYPVEVTKEKVTTNIEEVNILKWHQKVLMWLGGIALMIAALCIAWKFGKRKIM